MPGHLHAQRFRIVMSEVDAAQIHFTAILRWMDRGLSEWLADVGHPFTDLLETGPGIPVVDARVSFVGRIMLDDLIDLETWVGAMGNSSFRSFHEFRRAGERVAVGRLVHVCVDRDTRATVTVPDWIRAQARPDPVDTPWQEPGSGR